MNKLVGPDDGKDELGRALVRLADASSRLWSIATAMLEAKALAGDMTGWAKKVPHVNQQSASIQKAFLKTPSINMLVHATAESYENQFYWGGLQKRRKFGDKADSEASAAARMPKKDKTKKAAKNEKKSGKKDNKKKRQASTSESSSSSAPIAKKQKKNKNSRKEQDKEEVPSFLQELAGEDEATNRELRCSDIPDCVADKSKMKKLCEAAKSMKKAPYR
eukprot:2013173-Amphidinium_carterae.2